MLYQNEIHIRVQHQKLSRLQCFLLPVEDFRFFILKNLIMKLYKHLKKLLRHHVNNCFTFEMTMKNYSILPLCRQGTSTNVHMNSQLTFQFKIRFGFSLNFEYCIFKKVQIPR